MLYIIGGGGADGSVDMQQNRIGRWRRFRHSQHEQGGYETI